MWPYNGNPRFPSLNQHCRPVAPQPHGVVPSTGFMFDPQRAEIQPLVLVPSDRPAFVPTYVAPIQSPNFQQPFANNFQRPFFPNSQSPNNLPTYRFSGEISPNFTFPSIPAPRLPCRVQRPETFYYAQNCAASLPISSSPSVVPNYGHVPKPPPPASWIPPPPNAAPSTIQYLPRPPPPPPPPPKRRLVNINDILNATVSQSRPQRIVIVLRGLPGSGKTYAARTIKEKEFSISGKNPRILSVDDYFMVESDDDKNTCESKYEFNADLEKSYRASLLKSFKKTVDDGLFPFIIVDSCNDKISYFDEYVAHALSRGFVVYVGTVHADVELCKLRSHGRRKIEDVELMAKFWEPTPDNFLQVDVLPLVQPDINMVEMEDAGEESDKALKEHEESVSRKRKYDSEQLKEATGNVVEEKKSKWELMDVTEEEIDRLDGLRLKRTTRSSKESDNGSGGKEGSVFTDSGVAIFDNIKNEDLSSSKGSKKHISWADVEQYKRCLKERHNKFDRLLSEINARSALVKVHVI